jgi:hypothetical protein
MVTVQSIQMNVSDHLRNIGKFSQGECMDLIANVSLIILQKQKNQEASANLDNSGLLLDA